MEYKTELHCHSGDVSNCATATAQEIIGEYCAAGYTSLVLTDHFSRYTFAGSCGKFQGDPENHNDRVDFFISGYRNLQALAGDRLNILFGLELRSNRDENDYLIYGVDEDFLRDRPDIMDMSMTELREDINAYGGLLFQAHPFRNHMNVRPPARLDGIEVFNGNRVHDSRNDIALLWAEKHALLMSSGSDFHHSKKDLANGGIITDTPITDEKQLVNIIKNQNYRLLCAGEYPTERD